MKDRRKYTDRAKYLIQAVSNRRKKIRELAFKYKGGKCVIRGYRKCHEALEFHHLFGQKDFGISHKGYTRAWGKVRQELDKCILLCANCHREAHAGMKLINPNINNT
jgi:hypothetical protein